MTKTTLTLPWPPTSNHAYATVTNRGVSRRVKSSSARNYAALANLLTQRVHPLPIFTPTDRIEVTLTLYPPDNRRFDIANREKVLIDSIAATLGFNDNQIDRITIERQHPTPNGAVIATFSTLHAGQN
jgi:crossover junction endodeoxyribonuclease RusA